MPWLLASRGGLPLDLFPTRTPRVKPELVSRQETRVRRSTVRTANSQTASASRKRTEPEPGAVEMLLATEAAHYRDLDAVIVYLHRVKYLHRNRIHSCCTHRLPTRVN